MLSKQADTDFVSLLSLQLLHESSSRAQDSPNGPNLDALDSVAAVKV